MYAHSSIVVPINAVALAVCLTCIAIIFFVGFPLAFLGYLFDCDPLIDFALSRIIPLALLPGAVLAMLMLYGLWGIALGSK